MQILIFMLVCAQIIMRVSLHESAHVRPRISAEHTILLNIIARNERYEGLSSRYKQLFFIASGYINYMRVFLHPC